MAKGPKPLKPATQKLLEEGFAHHREGRLDPAMRAYRLVIAQAPDAFEAHKLLGVALRAKGQFRDAVKSLEKAAALAGHNQDVRYNFANALFSDGDNLRAAQNYELSARMLPGHAESWCGLGRARKFLNDLDGAVAAFDKAIQLNPANDCYPFERGLARLMLGDYVNGWVDYETRWNQPHLIPHRHALPAPIWQGQPIPGQRLLVLAEQGLGDTLQFARFIPELAARQIHVILGVQPPVHSLMARIPGVGTMYQSETQLPPFHCWCMMMSLPLLLGTTLQTLPAPRQILSADPARLAEWGERLGPKRGLRVGLVWAGRPTYADDYRRSPRLEPLKPLFKMTDVEFHALQMGDGREDLDHWDKPANFIDHGPHIRDMDDTAAIMSHLDLVISSCTAPAHLAGALGRPLWMMLHASNDWRWLRERTDSPWYPSARLFRQKRLGDWDQVVAEMSVELAALARPVI